MSCLMVLMIDQPVNLLAWYLTPRLRNADSLKLLSPRPVTGRELLPLIPDSNNLLLIVVTGVWKQELTGQKNPSRRATGVLQNS